MKLKKRFRPRIELLETRETPSVTTSFSGGNLTVTTDNTVSTAVTLTATSNTNIMLKINGNTIATYGNVGNVTVNEGNGASDSVDIELATFTLATNFNLNLGSGANDAVTIDKLAGNNGTITGRVTAGFGLGTGDTVTIGNTANGTIASLLGAFTVRGSSTGVAVAVDNASVLKGTNAFTNLADEPVATPTADAFSLSATASVPGSIAISNSGVGSLATINLIAGSVVNGSVSYTGGTAPSVVNALGTIGGSLTFSSQGADTIAVAASTNVGGNVFLGFGSNTNTYTTDVGFLVGGSLTINAGNGANAIALAGLVGQSVSITLGSGANSVLMDDGTQVGGSLTVNGGNGGDSVTLGAIATPPGAIAGNVTVSLGNGTNSFTETPNFVINGTTVRYTGGSGSDSVVISNPVNGYNLYVNTGGTVGSGHDIVNLSAVTALNSAIITFGVFGSASNGPGPITNKVWIPPIAPVSFTLTLINFP